MPMLPPEAWVPVLRLLEHRDAVALRSASPAMRVAIRAAHKLWAEEAMQLARMVVHVHCGEEADGEPLELTVTPVPGGYTVGDQHVARRLFVHEFPRVCCAAMPHPHRLWRVESFLAFTPEVARTLPLGMMGAVQCSKGLVVWEETRLASAVTMPGPVQLYAPEQWPAIFQRHARFLVALRVGGPKRHRTRRARRWTKVDV